MIKRSWLTITIKKLIRIRKENGIPYLFRMISKKAIANIDRLIKIFWIFISADLGKGLNVIGFFRYMLGNAETARTFVSLYQEAGLDYFLCAIDTGHSKIPDEELKPLKKKFINYPIYKKNIFFIHGNDIAPLYARFPQYFKGRYNMAVLWWEFETGMEGFIEGLQYLDEVIAYTDFVKDAILQLPIGKCKISKLTYPFVENWKILRTAEDNRNFYGFEKNDFIFFFNFDYYSSYRRKNPEGVVEAFASAFKNDLNVRLIIKTSNCGNFPEQVNRLGKIINNGGIDRQVLIINDGLSRDEMMTLMNAIDCYVSLHRGEGLGLGMLEAMWLGKPVIATAYGGNTEFMNCENSMLVRYKMIEANDDFPIYRNVKYWADPDIEQAVYYMKLIANDKNKREIYERKSHESILRKYDKAKIIKELHEFMK